MISAKALYASLLAVSFLPFLNAQYILRVDPPLPTIAPLFERQIQTCASTATLCNDGSGGCCDIGAACTSSKGVPICAKACAPAAPICTGVMDGFCCKIGYTCNYESTMCVTNTLGSVATPTFSPALTSSLDVEPTSSLQAFPSSTGAATVATSTPPLDDLPTSTSSTAAAAAKSSTSSAKFGSTATPSSEIKKPTSTSITSNLTAATPTPSVFRGAQDKLGFDMKVLLAGCGLAFLWAH